MARSTLALLDDLQNANLGRWRVPLLVGAGAAAGLALARLWARRRYDWTNKRVLIMGGSRGLGFLLARELVAKGCSVVITARAAEELAGAREALLAHRDGTARDVFVIASDVSEPSEVQSAVQLAREHLGGIDVLINNAGLIQVGPLDSMTLEDFDQALRTHFWGPLIATLAVLPEMRARGGGRVVNISSIGGLVPIPHLLPYVASKFALTGLSQGLQVELARDGVSVTTVCPGLMRTGSTYRALFKSQHRLEHAWFALGAATPITSMSAVRAARKILTATAAGTPLVVLSVQAKLLARLQALAPGLMVHLLSMVNRALPDYGGIGKQSLPGAQSETKLVPSLLTRLNDSAALDYGELGTPRV